MSYYIPLPCCECTASTNPCDLPCFVSAVATISGSINITGSGSGNRGGTFGTGVSPSPYTFNVNFSLDDIINLDSSGNGQTNSVVALFNQEFEYAAGVNCGGEDCTGSTEVDGVPTFGLSCPANVCIGGQQYQIGTDLSFVENDFQASNCNYFDGFDYDDHIAEYYCYVTEPLNGTSNLGLSYVACANNGFGLSFGFGDSTLNFSTTQESGYALVGQIFIDDLPPRPLYIGYIGLAGVISKEIVGSFNVVIQRVIGYIKDYECVAP